MPNLAKSALIPFIYSVLTVVPPPSKEDHLFPAQWTCCCWQAANLAPLLIRGKCHVASQPRKSSEQVKNRFNQAK